MTITIREAERSLGPLAQRRGFISAPIAPVRSRRLFHRNRHAAPGNSCSRTSLSWGPQTRSRLPTRTHFRCPLGQAVSPPFPTHRAASPTSSSDLCALRAPAWCSIEALPAWTWWRARRRRVHVRDRARRAFDVSWNGGSTVCSSRRRELERAPRQASARPERDGSARRSRSGAAVRRASASGAPARTHGPDDEVAEERGGGVGVRALVPEELHAERHRLDGRAHDLER